MSEKNKTKKLVLNLFNIFFVIYGILLFLKLFIVSSLGAIFTIPIFLALFFYVYAKVMSAIHQSLKNNDIDQSLRIILFMLIYYFFSTLFIIFPAKDNGPWGYDYRVDYRHLIAISIGTFIFFSAVFIYKYYLNYVRDENLEVSNSYKRLYDEISRFKCLNLLNLSPVEMIEDKNGRIFKIIDDKTYFLTVGYNLVDKYSVLTLIQSYFTLEESIFLKPDNLSENIYPNEYCTDEKETGNLVYLLKSV